ncbi:MAG: hypothetical protein HYX76_12610 [Acidobacteria bacterium]|nr:hypothetical protein [Acidobacteriota bacterium]
MKGKRLLVVTLSLAGLADALYMLAYTEGLIDHLACPFFGPGCEIVGRSKHAKHFGIPNSAVGALGYGAMATLATWSGDRTPEQRPLQPLALAAISGGAAAASAWLTYEMHAKVKAWCFWCLTSAAINAIILPLAVADGLRAWRALSRHGAAARQPGLAPTPAAGHSGSRNA